MPKLSAFHFYTNDFLHFMRSNTLQKQKNHQIETDTLPLLIRSKFITIQL